MHDPSDDARQGHRAGRAASGLPCRAPAGRGDRAAVQEARRARAPTLVRVQAARPGAKALLQLQSPKGASWTTSLRARLSSTGKATFRLGASVHRRLRVVVQGPAGESPLTSKPCDRRPTAERLAPLGVGPQARRGDAQRVAEEDQRRAPTAGRLRAVGARAIARPPSRTTALRACAAVGSRTTSTVAIMPWSSWKVTWQWNTNLPVKSVGCIRITVFDRGGSATLSW